MRETHGRADTLEYFSWSNMKQRCQNKKVDSYKYYGGRGITICNEWLNSFSAFLSDMGERPSKKHELDRKDSNGNYEPNNCRWATKEENNKNRRSTKLSWKDIYEIRMLYSTGSFGLIELGKIYGVYNTAISKIVNNKRWVQ